MGNVRLLIEGVLAVSGRDEARRHDLEGPAGEVLRHLLPDKSHDRRFFVIVVMEALHVDHECYRMVAAHLRKLKGVIVLLVVHVLRTANTAGYKRLFQLVSPQVVQFRTE